MAAPARLTVDSLGAAVEAFMNAPTARRVVVVSSVEVAHSAALSTFLTLQEDLDLWETENRACLFELVTIDRLFRAIVIDVLPVLVADPTSPTRPLLSRYAVYIQSSAPAVGGDFEQRATLICQDMISYANNTCELSAADLLHRLMTFRSERVTIAGSNRNNNDDGRVFPGMMGLDLIHVNSFSRLASFREEVIDSPPADYQVIINSLPTSHSSALLGVVYFECATGHWIVGNMGRLTALANVNVCFELIGLGLLPFLHSNPTSQPALQFLFDYVHGVRTMVGDVGGDFVTHATDMCNILIAHGACPLPPPEMRMTAEQLRRDLDVFRSRDLSIHASDITDDSSDASNSADESTSRSSDASNSTDNDKCNMNGTCPLPAPGMGMIAEELRRIRRDLDGESDSSDASESDSSDASESAGESTSS